MAELVVENIEKWFRREDGQPFKVVEPIILQCQRSFGHRFNRTFRVRQVDAAQFHCWA